MEKQPSYEVLPFVVDYKRGKLESEKTYSIVLLISLLVSLMVDQVCNLRERGVMAAILSGDPGVPQEFQATVADVRSTKYSLLYAAPEAVVGYDKWRTVLLNPPLSERVVAVAIDEAHCFKVVSSTFVYDSTCCELKVTFCSFRLTFSV